MLTEEQFAASASDYISCTWWGVASSPTATAGGQYWYDGTGLHISVAVINTQGVITGYAWNAFNLSATSVYINSATSAVYRYLNSAMAELTDSVAVIALQLAGLNKILNNINGI